MTNPPRACSECNSAIVPLAQSRVDGTVICTVQEPEPGLPPYGWITIAFQGGNLDHSWDYRTSSSSAEGARIQHDNAVAYVLARKRGEPVPEPEERDSFSFTPPVYHAASVLR